MATDLTNLVVTVLARIEWTAELDSGLADGSETKKNTESDDLTFGTGNGEVDLIWSGRRTLAGAAADSLDLAGGLTIRGGAITFAKVKAVAIRNRSDLQAVPTDASLTIGGAAANECQLWFAAAGDKETMAAHGLLLRADINAGWTVTGGSADVLKILNAHATDQAEYDIVIVGVSA